MEVRGIGVEFWGCAARCLLGRERKREMTGGGSHRLTLEFSPEMKGNEAEFLGGLVRNVKHSGRGWLFVEDVSSGGDQWVR